MLSQRLMWIAWPAFMVACVLEVLVFTVVDPQDLRWFGQPMEFSRQAIYAVAFFVFWGITMVSSGLTTLLSISPFEVNRCPVPILDRPDSCLKHGPD